ncbi:hypothetical protein PSTG_11108 [Puccinia striiformis f. sp. tritici PST-78]|uniref:Uncharacterized protein n=1 Tax=Puccinia striiformis f. sp. tritici PST-78 TaxID=1165861 RepID=A0A0L0V8K6_9BASI|nr:hypothetical protein PSTG_11108 [Puccinia striiformis f. sp. tritici PST-78]
MTVRAVAAGSGSVPSQAFHKMALANNSTCICNSKEMSRGGGKECRAILTTASETRDVSGESALEIAEEQAIDAEQVLHTGRSDIDGVHTDADSPAPQPLRQQSSEISEEPMNLEHARPVTPASRVQRQKKVGRVPIFAHSVWISKEIMVIADWWTILEGHDYRVKVGCRSVGAVTFQKPLKGGETHEPINRVTTFLQERPHFMDEFEEEHKLVVDELAASQKFGISGESIQQHFETNLMMHELQETISIDKFVKARAVQLKRKLPNDPEILDLERVFEQLPTDLELKSQLFRYSMIERFEKILEFIRPGLTKNLENRAQAGIKDVLTKSLTMTPVHDSIFKEAAKEDDAWHANAFSKFYGLSLSPSEVFERLKKPPTPQEIHAYVINKNIQSLDFLSKAETNKFRREPTRKAFRELMKEDTEFFKLTRGPKTSRILKAIGREAAQSYPVNLPLVDELFDKRVINEPLRELLITKAQVSSKQFAAALGTKEEFAKKLQERFEIDLVNHLRSIDRTEREQIVNEAARRFAQSRLDQLDHDAKSTYLTTDAFQKPNSFRFNEALEVYHPDFSESTQNPTDSKALARAYMDVAFSTQPYNPKSEKYLDVDETMVLLKQRLDKKLYEMENIFYEHFPRMGEFFENLLKDTSHPGSTYLNSVPISFKKNTVPYGSIDSMYLLADLLKPEPIANNIKQRWLLQFLSSFR